MKKCAFNLVSLSKKSVDRINMSQYMKSEDSQQSLVIVSLLICAGISSLAAGLKAK